MKYTIDLYDQVVKQHEKGFETLLRNQRTKAEDWQLGGVLNYEWGLVPYNCGHLVTIPIIEYFCKESKYYQSQVAYDSADKLFTFFYANLRPENLVDYHVANYHSGPDTAFVNLGFCRIYRAIEHLATDEKGADLKKRLYDAIVTLADGIAAAGFHTPNHRWVISAALSIAMNITGKKAYQKVIDSYLVEGIDCNEQGEYTERSTGGYNFINNMALLILAEELDKPEYLEPVRRNLTMMGAYYHTNHEIFTQNSTRQDRGTKVYAEKYLYQYLKAGKLLNDQHLLEAARAVLDETIRNGRPIQIGLDQLMHEKDLLQIPQVEGKLLSDYNFLFKDSGIARLQHKGMSVSIMENNGTFLYLQYGDVDMYIRGGIHFFNERHIKIKNLRQTATGYAMDYHGEGVYYLPFGEYKGTTDWEVIGRANRDTIGPFVVDATIELDMTDAGIQIHFKADGCTKVPIRFEIAVNNNAVIFGSGYTVRANAGGTLIPERGYVKVDTGVDGLKIGPAFASTFITEGLFGSEPVSKSRYNIFFSDLVPFDRTFTIEPIIRSEA